MCFVCVLFDIITVFVLLVLSIGVLFTICNFLFLIWVYLCDFYDCFKDCFKDCCHFNYVPKKSGVCTICLENVNNSPMECGHIFHTKCIKKWLKENDTCPNCRVELV